MSSRSRSDAQTAARSGGGDWQERYLALEKELVELTFTLSHDLRAPTRAAAGFARALEEGQPLSAEAHQYVEQIRAATRKMDRLIEAVAELGLVSRGVFTPQPVDLRPLAEEILEELRQQEPQRLVPTAVGGDLRVSGDPKLMHTLLCLLLNNAWTFTRQKPGAGIEVGRDPQGERPVFVRDEGVGFDNRYADKIFAPFRRLHPSDEERLGFGLTLARRIVRRHGGRLWAEGEPGRGACFRFTLPVG